MKTVVSFVIYMKTVCASLRRSLGKRTENWSKNTNVNTYLDPPPLLPCLPPPLVCTGLTFGTKSSGCQHETHFLSSVGLHFSFPHLRHLLLVQHRDLSPSPSQGDDTPSIEEKGSGCFVTQFSFFLVPFSL